MNDKLICICVDYIFVLHICLTYFNVLSTALFLHRTLVLSFYKDVSLTRPIGIKWPAMMRAECII